MSRNTPNARALAVNAVNRVLTKHQNLDDALAALPQLGALEARDRNFTYLLAITTLRHTGMFKAMLSQWMEKPLEPQHREVEALLMVGLTQLFVLGTPAHAAVHEMVELAKARFPSYAKLVNAILNRAAREGKTAFDAISPLHTLPEWLKDSWIKPYGEMETLAMARAQLLEPPLDLTVFNKACVPEGVWLTEDTLRLPHTGDVSALAGYAEGAWQVQDVSAALPVSLFSDLQGKTAFDLCAAPGGKTAQLAARGAEVTALDISANRLHRMAENLERLNLQARLTPADALLWQPEQQADAILLDAPCSSTGTLRRNPDVAWSKTPADVNRLALLQARLLTRAIELLKPGGELVYSVCSLEPEEGEAQIARVLEHHKDMKLALDVPPAITPKTPCAVGFRFLPSDLENQPENLCGMDGFFMTKLRKKPALDGALASKLGVDLSFADIRKIAAKEHLK